MDPVIDLPESEWREVRRIEAPKSRFRSAVRAAARLPYEVARAIILGLARMIVAWALVLLWVVPLGCIAVVGDALHTMIPLWILGCAAVWWLWSVRNIPDPEDIADWEASRAAEPGSHAPVRPPTASEAPNAALPSTAAPRGYLRGSASRSGGGPTFSATGQRARLPGRAPMTPLRRP